jgi:hypothetical protein
MNTKLALLFIGCISCSDDVGDNNTVNEVQVYSNVCQFSFTLKTKSYSTGRYDSDCEYEQVARFYKIGRDTIYYEATTGKRKTEGKVYHNGRQTQIGIDF